MITVTEAAVKELKKTLQKYEADIIRVIFDGFG